MDTIPAHVEDTSLENDRLVSRRGQGLYDWWSRHRNLFGRLYDIAFLGRESERRERAMESLSLFPDTDVPARLADRFASTRIATFDGGVTFIATARRPE